MATWHQVTERFIEQCFNRDARPLKSGNYLAKNGEFFLFGNRIAFRTEEGIDTNYMGEYSRTRSRITSKALNYLRWKYAIALRIRR